VLKKLASLLEYNVT